MDTTRNNTLPPASPPAAHLPAQTIPTICRHLAGLVDEAERLVDAGNWRLAYLPLNIVVGAIRGLLLRSSVVQARTHVSDANLWSLRGASRLVNWCRDALFSVGGVKSDLTFVCPHCMEEVRDGYRFMVHNDLWYETIPWYDQLAVFDHWCFEERLGRPLTLDDLIDAPINDDLRADLVAEAEALAAAPLGEVQ